MCGIAGFSGQRDDATLKGMSSLISHRGPDEEGNYFCPVNGVSFAHRRLSILDISGGKQPMWNKEESIGIIFNGEIYNHYDLRDELLKKGYSFSSNNSDTETLIHGYEEWGVDLLKKLNGMFAFCIYDKNKKKLFFARDRFGKKPLYYKCNDKKIIFASELKSLLCHPSVSADIDPISLQKYFGYGFIPAPYSIYKGIKKLPGGHYMTFDLITGETKVKSYWQFRMRPDSRYLKASEDDLASELRRLLTNAVNRRLIADVPVGIFLSGGIDSSSILACASLIKRGDKIKTFSIGFNESQFDESGMAKKIAHLFDVDHYEEILDINSGRNISNEVLKMLDEPMADSSILPTYLLAKFARKYVTVALGGDGGDELFAGYAPFKALKLAQIYCHMLPAKMRDFILKSVNFLPASDGYLSLDFKLKRTLQGVQFPPSAWNPAWLGPLRPDEISELMNIRVEWDELYADAVEAWNLSEAEDMVGKTSEFYARFYLQDSVLTKVDRASMMVGLEARAPFLDNEVVGFAQAIPSNLKLKNGISKYILKKSMEGILPNELLARPKKGFGIPLTSWLKAWPIDGANSFNCDPKFIDRMADDHRKGKRDNRLFLWSWIVLQAHMQSLRF